MPQFDLSVILNLARTELTINDHFILLCIIIYVTLIVLLMPTKQEMAIWTNRDHILKALNKAKDDGV